MGISNSSQDPTNSYKKRLTQTYSHTKWILPNEIEVSAPNQNGNEIQTEKTKPKKDIFDKMKGYKIDMPKKTSCHLCSKTDNTSNMLFCNACKNFFDNDCISKEIEVH